MTERDYSNTTAGRNWTIEGAETRELENILRYPAITREFRARVRAELDQRRSLRMVVVDGEEAVEGSAKHRALLDARDTGYSDETKDVL